MRTDISIFLNTIPVINGVKLKLERLGALVPDPATWKVSLREHQNASRWELHLEGPNGHVENFVFDGQKPHSSFTRRKETI